MNKGEEQPHLEKTIGEIIKEQLETAPARVQDEFERTGNTWLECFGSIIFQQECLLDLRKTKAQFGIERVEEALQDMQKLKEFHKQLKDKYPTKDTIPSTEIKAELFKKVNVLNVGGFE